MLPCGQICIHLVPRANREALLTASTLHIVKTRPDANCLNVDERNSASRAGVVACATPGTQAPIDNILNTSNLSCQTLVSLASTLHPLFNSTFLQFGPCLSLGHSPYHLLELSGERVKSLRR